MALNFPAKIYQILENESADIIRWHPNGAAFRIVDHGRFEREIIPKYFRHNQLSSVQRQLNLYGFKCISRGEDKGAFFHPKFRRGDWEVVKRITRYAPLKKTDQPSVGEKKEQATIKSESIETSSEAVAPSVSSATADGRFPGFPLAYPHFDSYFPPHPAGYDANNWHHWSLMHQHAMYPHMMAFPSVEPKPDETVFTSSDTASASSEATEPQKPSKAKRVDSDKSFLNVVNNVVTVDPYFDLSDDFGLFHSDELSRETFPRGAPKAIAGSAADVPVVSTAVAAATHTTEEEPQLAGRAAAEMAEVGVNTDLTMSQMTQLYRFCFDL